MHAESEENRNNYKTYFDNFESKLKPMIENEIDGHAKELIMHKSA